MKRCMHNGTDNTMPFSTSTRVHIGISRVVGKKPKACEQCIQMAVDVFEAAIRERLAESGLEVEPYELNT